ncbi:MAG TPA: hypothetical protein ENI97_15735 [Gammaproteobacteria bacterium]|nr:hypothetical protein [Gammaproteobacteria bacterium]
MKTISNHKDKILSYGILIPALIVISGCASTPGSETESVTDLPMTGLFAYTQSHAKNPTPPHRLGGPVTIKASQHQGSIRWALPGPRKIDPAVFGTPDHPAGWEKAPFPLLGLSPGMRQQRDGKYTIVDHATPFSDWMTVGVGDLDMILRDVTAIDGSTTEDEIHFEASFKAPDNSHDYRVVVDGPLPHGKLFPTFGGVVTDHIMHGATGIGTRLMPTEYAYAAFWAKGKIYVDGRLTNDNQLIHMMITEFVRGDGNKLGFDGNVGAGSTGKVMHLMVPPFRVGPKGLEPAPLKSGYIPFPQIKQKMMAAKSKIMAMPEGPAKQEAMANLQATKALMERTKKHVQEMMAEGKMFGMPFFHVMFGNLTITRE